MALCFSSKARTLDALRGVITSAHIAPSRVFTVAAWEADRADCLREVCSGMGAGPWIVRSSCEGEDGAECSNAGAFLSLLNIDASGLEQAIDKVISSYGAGKPYDEVMVQPMLTDVLRSGVAFTHDPNTCAPYRLINWSEGSDTTSVTRGAGGRLWQRAAGVPYDLDHSHPTLRPILVMLGELFTLFGNAPLDCEFAVTRGDGEEVLWLLQVRQLILAQDAESDAKQLVRLQDIRSKVSRGMQPHPFLMGRRTVYGVMPDWNPAEIVGIRPKPLALSLYRDLITDTIWAYQRHNYGYRNLRSFPLMSHFFGLPYIDVRVSFNSFIPADLEEGLAGRLVDHYIDKLLEEPTLHDKVEFEVVFSCYTLDLPARLGRLKKVGFSDVECKTIAASLRRLTNRIAHPKEGLWRGDAAKLENLTRRREMLLASSADPLERIYWLLEDAKRYGTLPFAGLARAGFVAIQMLKSLVAVGVFSRNDYDNFIGTVSTVSGQLARDRATLDQTTFLARYGHLRPGTYDILSPRYDEAPDLYFDWTHRPIEPRLLRPFAMTLTQMREISRLLETHGLQTDSVGLLDFMQQGIELREFAKFNFTRNLSDALSLIAQVGGQYGLSREDLAYCDVAVFKELHVAAENPKKLLIRSIEQGRSRYAETLKVALPPLIVTPEDVWAFEWPETSPNFVTQKCVTAPVVTGNARDALAGKIVCIPSADPGYDWLFSYPIAGLVTAWGGANSHMAIRAGELGLPAVIGVGEVLYRRLSSAQRLHVDCAGHRVEVLA